MELGSRAQEVLVRTQVEGGSKQIGRGLSHAPFRRNKARDVWQKTTRQALSTVQADRVTNRAGKDLNRSFGLADRGRPRECQYSPGLLSAWQGTHVGNPACRSGIQQRTDFPGS